MQVPVHVRALILGTVHLMVLLGATVAGLNVALPAMMEEFRVDITTAIWVQIAYFLAFTGGSFSLGALTTILNKRNLIIVGLVGDIIICVLIFFAPNIYLVIVGRLVQGLFRIFTWLTLQVMGVGGFPREQRGKAIGLSTMGSGLATLASIPLTGYVVDHWGWQWMFMGSAVFFVALIPAVLLLIPDEERRSDRPRIPLSRFDIPGSLLMLIGVVALVTSLQFIAKGITPALTIPLGLTGAIAIVGFVRVELRASSPIVQLSLLRIRGVLLGATQAALIGVVSGAFLLLLPLLFIQGYGWTAVYASSVLLFVNLARPPSALAAGWLSDRLGSPRVILPGALLTGAALLATALLSGNIVVQAISAALFVWGLGTSLMQTANARQIFSSLPQNLIYLAPSISLVLMMLGSTVGQTLAAMAIQRGAAAETASIIGNPQVVSAAVSAMVVMTAVFAVGMVITQLLPRLLLPPTPDPALLQRLQAQGPSDE